ncbi:MucR family transcriptional regulator [Sphingomonas sp. BK069]|uniref:MucR family transcriptional regulator n=1 Tax=Sphingomonas sp. BK069 TaxID=2586979 RepID=UPI001615AB1E|nr:MucR family transcriptional regulator [Sphingomonas sp. BK069]MBB3348378.1 putative transcriptional regulator [Sphingomonas sp. BK069]
MVHDDEVLALATDLTVAWIANTNTRTEAAQVSQVLQSVVDALSMLSAGKTEEEPTTVATPAVSIRKSLADKNHIISLIDGRPYKSLRRHLAANGLTPEEYRARYGLKRDYPMVAENYSEARRAMAKELGLGRKPAAAAAEKPLQVTADAETRKGSGRRPGTRKRTVA